MEYAAMYRQLGRTDRFRAEYCRARAGAAHRRWFASATSLSGGTGVGVAVGGGVGGGASRGEEAGATGSGLVTWLPPFLEYLQVCKQVGSHTIYENRLALKRVEKY